MEKTTRVNIPPDEEGLTGRECPNCEVYFKVKFGTGLSTSVCKCPYCGHAGEHDEFFTKDQEKYAISVAVKDVLGPELEKLNNSLKELEQATRGGLVQIKVKSKGLPLRIKYYQERELETYVKCDKCELEFAIYGVFANCPDCGQLNASLVFRKSIEGARKWLHLLDMKEFQDQDSQQVILEDALSGGVSAFDAFGKALVSAYPNLLPKRPKNVFQNLSLLSKVLLKSLGKSLSDLIGKKESKFLLRMFQVRHIFEHNMGVVDADFVKNVPDAAHLKGRKHPPLKKAEVEKLLDILATAGPTIQKALELT